MRKGLIQRREDPCDREDGESRRQVADLVRACGITERPYYRWKAKYSGLEVSGLQRVKQLDE